MSSSREGDDDSGEGPSSHLLSLLHSGDYIMECGATETAERWLAEGGDTAVLVAALADGYVGRAQICNTMTSWLSDLGEEELAVECVESSTASAIKRHFHPDTADGIFTSEEGSTSSADWMPQLVSHRRWRSMVYELVEQFPACLMLNFAVRLISDAGFQSEISNVNTATQQLEIYSRVMLEEMKVSLDALTSEKSLVFVDKALHQLVRVVSQSEQSYVYTMAMLEGIARSAKGKESATAQFLSEAIRERLEGKAYEGATFRCAVLQSPEDNVAVHVTTSLVSMMSKSQLNPADVCQMYQQYIMPRPPPVMLIRDQTFLFLLYDSLFSFDKPRVGEDHRDKFIFLLAYASAVTEKHTKKHRSHSRIGLDGVRTAIEKAVQCTEGSLDEVSRSLTELVAVCRHPSVAGGVLHYVRSVLLSENRLGDAPSFIFILLDHVATTHSNLHNHVFEICTSVYEKVSRDAEVSEIIMSRQKTVVDRLVHLFSVGAALPVLEKISRMYAEGSIDASLVRYFVVEVLDMIAPPYSCSLVSLLLPLVTQTEIIDDVIKEKTPSVDAFIRDAKETTEKKEKVNGKVNKTSVEKKKKKEKR